MKNPTSFQSPTRVYAAMCRAACVVTMIGIQFLTSDDVMSNFAGYWSTIYLIVANIASIAIVWSMKDNSVTASVIDIAIYEILFYCIYFFAYIVSRDLTIFLAVNVYHKVLAAFFLLIVLRIIWPTTWPACGIISRLAAPPDDGKPASRILLAIAVLALLAIACLSKYLPRGWSQWAIGASVFYMVGFHWKTFSRMAVKTVEEKEETKSDNQILRRILDRDSPML